MELGSSNQVASFELSDAEMPRYLGAGRCLHLHTWLHFRSTALLEE